MAWNEHIDVYNSSLWCQLVTDWVPKSTIWVHILNQSLYKMGVKQDCGIMKYVALWQKNSPHA